MKILATSDLHSFKPELEPCDVFVIAGDITANGHMAEAEEFLEWLERKEEFYKHAIVVAGNHDWVFRDTRIMHDLFDSEKIHYLCNEAVTIDGIKFWGSPYTPEFMGWAFMLPDEELGEKIWSQIPSDTDVLITHGGPKWHLDGFSGRRVGSETLFNRLLEIQPKVNIFGHIHEAYGRDTILWFSGACTELYNVAYCDGSYRPGQKPQMIEL